MPVTAKLSQKFYERFGEDVTNELVEWFNAVDAAYKTDLRELNELNFQRFDARVEQRFAELRAKVDRRFADADVKMERRFADADVKMERRFAEAAAAVDRRLAELGGRIGSVERKVADTRADLVKWMFGFWMATLVPLAGLMVGLATVLH